MGLSSPLPASTSTKSPCRYSEEGCKRGAACTFQHDMEGMRGRCWSCGGSNHLKKERIWWKEHFLEVPEEVLKHMVGQVEDPMVWTCPWNRRQGWGHRTERVWWCTCSLVLMLPCGPRRIGVTIPCSASAWTGRWGPSSTYIILEFGPACGSWRRVVSSRR